MENKDSTSSFVNTLRGFGLGRIKIDREELKKQTQMPKYLREAMDLAIRSKNAQVVAREVVSPSISAEIPIVVFINEKSGGRLGPALKVWFQEFLGPEQVIYRTWKTVNFYNFFFYRLLGCYYSVGVSVLFFFYLLMYSLKTVYSPKSSPSKIQQELPNMWFYTLQV